MSTTIPGAATAPRPLARICRFELRYQLRQPVFIVNAIIFFLLAFLATTIDKVHIGDTGNGVHVNSPFMILQITAILSLFAMAVPLRLFSDPVLRDGDTGMAGIVQAMPVPPALLLTGRLIGALAPALLVVTASLLGILVGSFMGWVDPDRLGPLRPGDYLYALAVIGLPDVLLTGGLFFLVAALTRQQMATYVAMIALLVAYITGVSAMHDSETSRAIAAYADPFGISALESSVRYWTVTERNGLLPALSGAFLVNRLLWGGIGLCLFALGVAASPWGARRAEGRRGDGKPVRTEAGTGGESVPVPSPATGPATGGGASGGTLWPLLAMRTRFEALAVVRSPVFWVILALSLLNMLGALLTRKGLYDTPAYPVTREIVQLILGTFSVMPWVVAVNYTGEMVWRERQSRIAEIIGATPAPGWVFSLSKFLALALVLAGVWLIPVLPGIALQLAKGPVPLEPGLYLTPLLAMGWPDSLILAALAVLIQVLSPNKFVGYAILLVFFVIKLSAVNLGLEDPLLIYGRSPLLPLSDMNGYGHFLAATLSFSAYWGCAAAFLLLLSHLMWPRGRATTWRDRLHALRTGWSPGTRALAALFLLLFIVSGGWIFWNTHVRNSFSTEAADDATAVAYEQAYRPYETLPQPRITDVQVDMDLYPAEQGYTARGHYRLENRSGQPITAVHMVIPPDVTLDSATLEGGTLTTRDRPLHYYIFTLKDPLPVGGHLRLDFATSQRHPGFTAAARPTQVVGNGSFVRNFSSLPAIGFEPRFMLSDKFKRRKHGLPPIDRMPRLEDQSQWRISLLGRGADEVNFDTTVSTVPDQIAVAPGYLEREWSAADASGQQRRYFHYRTQAPIMNFESWQSARYAVARDRWNDVDLAVYHHPPHAWNVERMMNGMKQTLAYASAQFGPYQHHQMRILEFPDYEKFAQSFASTVPFSEGIGFIADNRDPARIDIAFYVTAHEVAHQWWGHQVTPAYVQGATLPVETLAQYTALMVMEHRYGPNQIRKFLKAELDRYLSSRGQEDREEVPLARVEDQPYLHYRKGAVVMYALKDYLGEDTVNRALARLVRENAARKAGLNSPDAATNGSRYALSTDLIAALRAEARPEDQTLITDMLEKIVLYDLKVTGSSARPLPDGRTRVALTVHAAKLEADGKGVEHPVPFTLPIDIGLFLKEPGTGDFADSDVIHLGKQPIHDGDQTIELVVDRKPAFVGIDPYNKLIDRNSDDNVARLGM